ncbi:MAG: YbjN domain-containing protein [Cellulomonadaceae bacterium]|nr:YbjN domain-containing protein [Cellulomonadaceae bacterium]
MTEPRTESWDFGEDGRPRRRAFSRARKPGGDGRPGAGGERRGDGRLAGLRRLAAGSPRVPVPRPEPITMDRVAAELERCGYHVDRDDDGDITGIWDGSRFWFMLLGEHSEILQVRGRWEKTVPSHLRFSVLQAANDWNRDRLWPKVYLRDEGELSIYTEVSVDFEAGATDAQLSDTIACGLVTASQFFGSLGLLVQDDD